MTNWRADLRGRGYYIDDEPLELPSVPPKREPELSRWTVAWLRHRAADGSIRETIRLPDGYEWNDSRTGVHDDKRYMSRIVENPDSVSDTTIFDGYGKHYLHYSFFKWIAKADS